MAHAADRSRLAVGVVTLTLVGGVYAAPEAPTEDGLRAAYRQANAALEQGRFGAFRSGLERTQGYVLHPFLVYRFMRRRLAEFAPGAIDTFLARYADAVITVSLRDEWLLHLARRGQWQTFLAHYRDTGGGPELECFAARARLEQHGIDAHTEALIEKLWLHGASRPASCDAVFDAWQRAGGITAQRAWARIQLALKSDRPRLADWLARRYLPPPERRELRWWIEMRARPATGLAREPAAFPDTHAAPLVRYGIERLMQRDPTAALAEVGRWRERGVVNAADADRLRKDIAISAAQRGTPEALSWLTRLPTPLHDDESRRWQAHAALARGDWATLAAAVAGMSQAVQQQPQWRYWRARAYLETGDRQRADRLFAELAATRHYYGFLAADRVARRYAMTDRPVATDPQLMGEIAARRGIRMALELRAVGENRLARRQWTFATRGFSESELRQAAVLASRSGWVDRAIADAARSGYRDDLTIRFPLAHRSLVERHAESFGVDRSLIFGVIRQESAFMSDAESSAGALGLMQLLPGTGKRVARALKRRVKGRAALLAVENNIQLGSGYLRQMLDEFGRHPVLAAAAYNAGPRRVQQWIPDRPTPADVWIETIPFSETRNYVKNVLAFMMVYDYRLGREARRMTHLMRPVSTNITVANRD